MEVSQKAWDFVEKYSDGGKRCTECRYSIGLSPGDAHLCLVSEGGTKTRKLDPTDCPALPDELYPEL